MSDDMTVLPDGIDESEREAWEIYLSNGNDADADWFREHYLGCDWENPADYVAEVVNDMHTIPDDISWYVDWKSMANDWRANGDIWWEHTTMGVTHLFRG